MRKIIADIAMSIDGFVEDAQGRSDWLELEQQYSYLSDALDSFDTLFCGLNAYERLDIPRRTDPDIPEPERSFNETLNQMRKYVFSSSVKHVRGNGMVVYQNLEQEVKRIRDEDGKDIWFSGGSKTLKTFVSLDLIDEYRLAVHPVVLGSGKPFFGHLTNRLRLRLIGTRTTRNGVVHLHYQPQNRVDRIHWL